MCLLVSIHPPSLFQEKKQVIKVAVAGLAAAAMLMANSPAAFADEDEVKQRICAAQPTGMVHACVAVEWACATRTCGVHPSLPIRPNPHAALHPTHTPYTAKICLANSAKSS